MLPADALASIDIAWIFSAIFLRSRSTLERLPRASDRLPPDFCWIAITMPKKFASGTGIRSNRRAQASPSGMPIAWVSMMARNSPLSGSGASAATTLIESNSGRPALMPRTITSTASGSALRKACSRRFLKKPRAQRGRPKPAAKARPVAPSNPPPPSIAATKISAASTAETTVNFWVDQLRPACVRRTLVLVDVAGDRFGFCHRGTAAFGLLLSRQQRVEEDPGDAADRDGCQRSQCERLHVHGAPLSSPLLRRHPAPPQAASLRRNSVRVPRTVAVRYR